MIYHLGTPYSSMILMIVLCVVLGIILSYVTIKTEKCIYAAIIHGVVNTIGELSIYFSITLVNGLLGPEPTGLLVRLADSNGPHLFVELEK